MKKGFFIVLTQLFVFSFLFGQGVINNDARIIVSNGAYLIIGGGASGNYTNSGTGLLELDGNVLLEGNWINNGSNDAIVTDATPDGLVTLNGTTTQDVGGSGKTVFENLTINNANGARITSNNNTVDGTLNLTNGTLNLNSNTFIVTNSATTAIQRTNGYFLSNALDLSFSSRVQWNIGTTTGNHIYPFGNGLVYTPIGFNISGGNSGNVTVSSYPSSSATAALVYDDKPTIVTNLYGTTTTNVDAANQNGANIIRRFWFINPSVNPTSAEVSLSYATSEEPINAIEVNNVWQQTYNESTNKWELLITSNQTSNTTTRVVTRSNITDFSNLRIFGIAKNSAPLPIELISFESECIPNGVLLKWKTATESNNKYFSIEKSYNASDWFAIEKIEGSINSNTIKNYNYIDYSKLSNHSYYRLVQRDLDGNSHYYEPLISQCVFDKEISFVQVFSNGMSDEIKLIFDARLDDDFSILLTDMLGKKLLQKKHYIAIDGQQEVILNLPNITPGIYLLTIRGKYQSECKKIYLE